MRALVTGASGFIGSHLLAGLRAAGQEPVARVRKSSKLEKILDAAGEGEPFALCVGELDDLPSMVRCFEGVDIVYHVAGVTAAFDPEVYERANEAATRALFAAIEACERPPRRVVVVSSLIAAGPSEPSRPRGEAHRITPTRTLYGDTKLGGERVAWEAAQRGVCEVVIVRPPMVYGPRDEDVLQMIRSANKRVVAQPGIRGAWHSAIHVSDLVDGIIAAGERGRPLPRGSHHVLAGAGLAPGELADPIDPIGAGIYYFTDGERHTIASFGQTAAMVLDRRALTLRFPRPLVKLVGWFSELVGRLRGQVPALTLDKAKASCLPGWWCDDRRARLELGWRPRFGLERGLAQTIAWYRTHGVL